ncbi:L-lysine 2,3-aminomutase [Slackia heliotrinireducens]|uniref:KamA family protein n=1 Tax=Slackia heliotrinireducens (strain ATCC 29202 / DSM 20476 / NCTC 11029 / RHS 1) TaxID=471855 RepID=C7N5R9_SLAHD|nr:KamA family radical SAM protein [Slackia heliotrinireducens]ACV22254.1 KamA family protein [Slackia heliotrinireducens DSM 20476]VEH00409.1 L-lysine 2,3-aminomutase [Slackia heliotrinireducens]
MANATVRKNDGWQGILAESCSDIQQLRDFLQLSDADSTMLESIQENYPLLVNPYYLSLVNPNDPDDPVRRMCIPAAEELDFSGLADTSGESKSTVLPGLQHKYAETALVLSTNQCAMYCRHCFRRRLVGRDADETVRNIDAVADYIRDHEEITNVLISGGDALMNSNETLFRYLEALAPIPHLKTIRLGTRIPVVLPQRITDDPGLIDLLSGFNHIVQLHVVTQFNHPNEITPESRDAIRILLELGIPVRNQTVLLKGVNDTPETLARLMDDLVGIGIVPYYVFQCRPTVGVKNRFQVPILTGCNIVAQARAQLSGLAKSFRYIMSHDAGKIELLGPLGAQGAAADAQDAGSSGASAERTPVLVRFHQARNRKLLNNVFPVDVAPDDCWFVDPQAQAESPAYELTRV